MTLIPFLKRSANWKKSEQRVVLENIRIASPCTASWDKMAGDGRARHCAECQLNVYNISAMTRKEAEQLITSHEGRLCLRFYRRSDGTVLTQDCPRGLRAVVKRVAYVAGAALSAVMSLTFAAAQNAAVTGVPILTDSDQKGTASLGVLALDQQGAVIVNAEVAFADAAGKVLVRAKTDSNGRFHWAGITPGSYVVTVKAHGFKAFTRKIELKDKPVELRTQLKIAETTVTVEVGGVAPVTQGTMGLVIRDSPNFAPMSQGRGRPSPLRQ
jgi:hypothetical protein